MQSLNTGSNNISGPISDPTSSQALLPIYNLESVEFVDCDGICESIVYGMPLIVKPTTCWKLDWEELERNQQYFQALCLTMKSKVLNSTHYYCTELPYRCHFISCVF